MKYKKIYLSFLCLSLIIITAPKINSFADNGDYLQGTVNRPIQGSNYWHTSNLREWLNSNDSKVNYTNNPPTSDYFKEYSYDQQAGFLTNFTATELNGIATTQLDTLLAEEDAEQLGVYGGTLPPRFNDTTYIAFNIPNFSSHWKSVATLPYNDKVFILSAKEILSYYQERGWSIMKEVTPEVRQKYGLTVTTHSWSSRTSRTEINEERLFYISANENDPILENAPCDSVGLSPAMHLKPTTSVKRIKAYILNNIGTHNWVTNTTYVNAGVLNIGDIIEYGTYMNAPIEWRVINKTKEGYPLLSAEKVIDIKPWDAPGDLAWSKSNIIFDNADVVADDYYVHNTQNNAHTSLPVIKVTNETELYTRHIDSFTINLEITDEAGINRIILPDGNVLKNPPKNISYTISKNGFYDFKAIDNYGNQKDFIAPVGNINLSTTVVVEQSDKNWTNQNVNVNIQASNDVNHYNPLVTVNGRDVFGSDFPNYTSYADKKFRITAEVSKNFANKDITYIETQIGFSYFFTYVYEGEFIRDRAWTGAKVLSFSELENGKVRIEVEYAVPNNYFSNLMPWYNINVPHDERAYSVSYSNIAYELIDNDDFAITKIELPNGQTVAQKQYGYTIDTEGELIHIYKVHDNRGMVNEKSIITKIDKTKPTLEISEVPKWTNEDVVLTIQSSDYLSGLKELITPKEVYTFSGDEKHNTTITFTQNGTYQFKLVDLAGNETFQTVVVSGIDKISPTINYTKTINANKQDAYLNINVTDSFGEIDYVELSDGTKTTNTKLNILVSSNGLYPITAVDKAGNKSSVVIPVTELTNADIIPSNIDRIEYKLSGATVQNWTTYTGAFYISNEGITTITARSFDKAGNVSSEQTSIAKVDKTKPNNNSIIIQLVN